ncbi:WAP four-disulfide core domain protein 2 [Cricetulus griseus]|uniref:WAP four-disulfide core domain protein 2 n=1 Tax=Cricetulus griseus TaxID=10029 RepID=G3HLT7_CRIGR|nr:WAP four-disulfide core domain protein 2 [Cricetulus griseus]ERE71608.1 WAP four-disulfide core domain protein 2 [Cricetulus griseus]
MPACRLCLRAAGLLGLLLLTHLSGAGAGAEKPGVCPQLQSNTDCVKECSSDNNCQDNLKCCQAGCSSVCSPPNGLNEKELRDTTLAALHTSPSEGSQVSTTPRPVVREEGDLEKQGACPSVDFPKLGICEDQCQVDTQCPGNMKCCRNGCGKMTCATPKF